VPKPARRISTPTFTDVSIADMDDIVDIIDDVHDAIDDVPAYWQCGVCFYTMNAYASQRCKSCSTHVKKKKGYYALTGKHVCLASSSSSSNARENHREPEAPFSD
jgi:hypothetical protein